MKSRRILMVLMVLIIASGFVFASGQPQRTAASAPVEIRWYIGLGAGSDEPTFAPQQAVVDAFNASQNRIRLVMEIVDADQAQATLATMIAAGNAPDIVGPVGIKGRDNFRGAWLDLTNLIAATHYDLSVFDPDMVNFYITDGHMYGLPFGIYPSFYYINHELFDEAGLPYPPQVYGQPYVDDRGRSMPWNMETVRYLGMRLTVDANGNDATSPQFDPDNIVQFGFGQQYTDLRGVLTSFGAGSFVDANGRAVMPANWRAGLQYYYDGMWRDHFIPNAQYGNSDLLANGDWFASGHVAMVQCHIWYAGFANLPFEWNTAVVPASPYGTTAKLHADTFEIMASTQHPAEAFEVLAYLVGPASQSLLNIYGGMPARLADQASFFSRFEQAHWAGRGINWGVVTASMNYPDNPNHESWLPSYLESTTVYNDFWGVLQNNPGLNLNAEVATFLANLQVVFSAAR